MCCPFSATTCDAGGNYIMNPSTSDKANDFSPCTVGNICSAFKGKSVNTSCLSTNKDVTVITEQECGNGIVEAGEECDCGGTAGCGNNACCDPTTCKFKNGAICDDSNEDCCTNCRYTSANTICRASNGDCDPAERCTGNSSTCPQDIIAKDGTSCGNGLMCASGQCTSRDLQCQAVMGRISSNNDTRSCDSTNCVLTCQSPELGADICLRMQQNFLDGTPCRGDGVCKNGYCSGASALGEVKSWIDSHRNVVIGVASGVGALLLFSILSCCFSRCRRGRNRRKRLPPYTPPRPGFQMPGNGAYPQPPPPAMGQRQFSHHSRRGGSESAAYAGYQPYQQPPSYSQPPALRYA